ncbi:MAG: HEAT repeat domain-containing protein [Planctomycetes bacterium]|nr:HEAT repeat domain-containing protein [Planctomycetota bacterium]
MRYLTTWRRLRGFALLLCALGTPFPAVEGDSPLESALVRAYHDQTYWSSLWVTMQGLGEPGLAQLAEIARSGQLEARVMAMNIFGATPSLTGVVPLVAGLEDADAKVRVAAAGAVAAMLTNSWLRPELIGHGVAERMIELCFDVDGGVRAAAAKSLALFDPADGREALLTLLTDPDQPVREAAAFSLWLLGVFPPLETTVALLQDPGIPLRGWACRFLSKDTSDEASRALAVATHDVDPGMRRAALSAMRGRNQPEAIDALIDAMTDVDEYVRRTADSMLRRVTVPPEQQPRLEAQRAEQRRLYPSMAPVVPPGPPE